MFENGTQSAFGYVARMMGNGDVAACGRGEPDFKTARCLSVKLKSECFEPLDDLPLL